jgi:hypothetical protein
LWGRLASSSLCAGSPRARLLQEQAATHAVLGDMVGSRLEMDRAAEDHLGEGFRRTPATVIVWIESSAHHKGQPWQQGAAKINSGGHRHHPNPLGLLGDCRCSARRWFWARRRPVHWYLGLLSQAPRTCVLALGGVRRWWWYVAGCLGKKAHRQGRPGKEGHKGGDSSRCVVISWPPSILPHVCTLR